MPRLGTYVLGEAGCSSCKEDRGGEESGLQPGEGAEVLREDGVQGTGQSESSSCSLAFLGCGPNLSPLAEAAGAEHWTRVRVAHTERPLCSGQGHQMLWFIKDPFLTAPTSISMEPLILFFITDENDTVE